MQKKVTLSLNDKIYKKFQEFCEKNGLILSKKVEICMENYMEENLGERR